MALPKKEKLKNRTAFRKSYQLKVIEQNKYFKLIGKKRVLINEKPKFPKVGFVLSRKKVKLATKRNFIKRRLEEAYRITRENLKPKIYYYEYLIFFPEAICETISFNELLQSLELIK